MLENLVGASYRQLPSQFYARVDPTRVTLPRLIKFNHALARDLLLDDEPLDESACADFFCGNRLVPGSTPIAMAYAGHQFGHFVPQLGDGRAILLGEVHDRFGDLRDIQLKGSGRTPYSRNGDGRAAVGPVLREYLVSEAMHVLGIPSTRALAAVATGDEVFRERPLPGAVLTRVASSHVRVGTCQYFSARGDWDATRQLADYVIARLYPDIEPGADAYLQLLNRVLERQARLVAEWMGVGFIHGVMNTDNMALSGETIDFGPCAFVDSYDPETVFSSIDHQGRYAYANQPAAAQWNLARLAEALLPLIHADQDQAVALATTAIERFLPQFDARWTAIMRAKLGLISAQDEDGALIRDLLAVMQTEQADFTLTFRGLCDAVEAMGAGEGPSDASAYGAWSARWRARLACEPQSTAARAAAMRLVNPYIVPRNHRIEQVIVAAVEHGDYRPFDELHEALSRPYEERREFASYAEPPQTAERVTRTFCGT